MKGKKTVAKIKCKCGRRIKLPKAGLFKTHAHCGVCHLEWHRVGNHIYSHPYYKNENNKKPKGN